MRQVYVHGLGQTPAIWEPVLRRLDAPGDRACPDLAAMAPDRETTYPALYHAFSQLCNGLEAPLALCGLSLGGVLALHYAAQYPERVGALVLMAAQYRMPKRLLQVQNVLFRFMPSSSFRETCFAKAQFLQLCGSMAALDLSEAISRITCPALVLCGSQDRANKGASMELAQLLHKAELHIVEGAGHELNREVPETLAPLLQSFYARVLS